MTSIIRISSALAAFAAAVAAYGYTPPIGIPNPAAQFGWEIDRATPAFPASWTAGTPSETAGFYYVDKTSPLASASSPTHLYGHPGAPLNTIPEGSLAAGSFIYVHAGTYTATDSGGDRFNWFGTGTSVNPIWITGNPTTRPVIQDLCQIAFGGSASYIIFENFEISGVGAASLSVLPNIDGNTADHILIRNIVRVGTQAVGDRSGVAVGLSQSTDTIPNSSVTDVVIYNCTISNLADLTTSDIHGVSGGYHTRRVWVLDSLIHHCGGDSVQASHFSDWLTKLTEDWYIGRNTFYGNGENGIDIKNVIGFVISENTIYGPYVREQGWGIVIHGGAPGAGPHAKFGSVLFNNLYHLSGAIYTASEGVDNMDIVGNKIWDIKRAYQVSVDVNNGAVILIKGSTAGANSVFRIVDNTFHDYERGLLLEPKAGDSFKVHGNIFSNRSNPAYFELEVTNNFQQYVTLDYNFYTGTPAFQWGNLSRTLTYMQTTALQEAHSILGTPGFVDASAANFALTVSSPAIDVSVEGPVGDSVYTAVQNRVGVAIKKDILGLTRPVDTLWDIGAYESALPPPAPSGLTVGP